MKKILPKIITTYNFEISVYSYTNENESIIFEYKSRTFYLKLEHLDTSHKTYLHLKVIITILLNIVIGEISNNLLINVLKAKILRTDAAYSYLSQISNKKIFSK